MEKFKETKIKETINIENNKKTKKERNLKVDKGIKQNMFNSLKIIFKIFKIILLILVFFIIIFLINLIPEIASFIKKEKKYINIYGFSPLTIISGSMVPNIQIGDIVLIKNFEKPDTIFRRIKNISKKAEENKNNKENKNNNNIKETNIKKEKLQKEDIATYVKEGSLITHRIVDLKDESVIFKGDNNNTLDTPVKYEDIIGKEEKIIKRAGIYIKIFKEANVLIPFLSSIFLFFIASNIDEYEEEKKNQR